MSSESNASAVFTGCLPFTCALLNSQPMGFYAPAQLVRDAREHGVEVRPVDVNYSDWDCTLEPRPASTGGVALRLGFRQIKGLAEVDARRIVDQRQNGYGDTHALWTRAGLSRPVLERLAHADTFSSIELKRRPAQWEVAGIEGDPLPLFAGEDPLASEPKVDLPEMTIGQEVVADYTTLRMSLKMHPVALLRERLARAGIVPAVRLTKLSHGKTVSVSGLVLVRQRPDTASGVIFVTLEDETGTSNIIVWPSTFEKFRREVLTGRLLAVKGPIQREGIVAHIIAQKIIDHSHLLRELARADGAGRESAGLSGRGAPARDDGPLFQSRDFH